MDYEAYESGDLLKKKKKKKKKSKEGLDETKKKKTKSKKKASSVLPTLTEPKKKKKKKTESVSDRKKKAKQLPAVTNNVNTNVETYEYQEEIISSEFDAEYQRILQSTSVEDRDQIEEYNLMFRKLQTISRTFEEKSIKGSSKDVYALMKVYDQMREVIADMKALKDVTALADSIQQQALLPFAKSTVQELSNFRSIILKNAKLYLQPKDIVKFEEALDQQFTQCGYSLDEAYRAARNNIVELYAE